MMRWIKTDGYRSYASDCGEVDIMYCQNAPYGKWRLRDFRGPFPKSLEDSMSFHRTLSDAKQAVR